MDIPIAKWVEQCLCTSWQLLLNRELCIFKASYRKQMAKGYCEVGPHCPWAVHPGSWPTVGHKYRRSKIGTGLDMDTLQFMEMWYRCVALAGLQFMRFDCFCFLPSWDYNHCTTHCALLYNTALTEDSICNQKNRKKKNKPPHFKENRSSIW